MNTTEKIRIDQSEWDAQERGMRAARGQGPDGTDAATSCYRRVADALITYPGSEPPEDFAAAVAAHVARHEVGIERILWRVLLVAFALASIAVTAIYGGRSWQVLHLWTGDAAMGWMSAGAVCAVLSWLFSRLLEFADHGTHLGHAR